MNCGDNVIHHISMHSEPLKKKVCVSILKNCGSTQCLLPGCSSCVSRTLWNCSDRNVPLRMTQTLFLIRICFYLLKFFLPSFCDGFFDYPAFLSLWLTRLSAMNCSVLITDQSFEQKVIGREQTSAAFLSIYTGKTQESISRPANTRLLTNLFWFILW